MWLKYERNKQEIERTWTQTIAFLFPYRIVNYIHDCSNGALLANYNEGFIFL